MPDITDNTNDINKTSDKKKLVVKVVAIIAIGVACLFGCCDLDCLLFNLRAFLGVG